MDVSDDSGFLALVVPESYRSFVAEDWDFERLTAHFRQEICRRSMLIWGTGGEGTWQVELRIGGSSVRGFREIVGSIRIEGGAVLVTNYESLTMAAQFADVVLPLAHERNQLFEIPDGDYNCRIVQFYDPESVGLIDNPAPHFLLVLEEPSSVLPSWSVIPWFEDT